MRGLALFAALALGAPQESRPVEDGLEEVATTRLDVRLLGPDGAHWGERVLPVHFFTDPLERDASLEVRSAGPIGEPLRIAEERLRIGDDWMQHWRDGGSRWTFAVRHGERYVVSAQGRGFHHLEVVAVPEHGVPAPVVIRALPPVEPAVLSLALPAGGFANVELQDPGTGYVWHQDDASGSRRNDFAIPPGRYRLVVEGAPLIGRCSRAPVVRRTLDRVERLVDLWPGQRLDLDLAIPPGARLDLALRGAVRVEDREAVEGGNEEYRPGGPGAEDPPLASLASVELVSERFGSRGLQRTWEGTGWAMGTRLTTLWPLGVHQMSEVVTSGEYVLVATLPGGREVRERVVLRSGETTPVVVNFGP